MLHEEEQNILSCRTSSSKRSDSKLTGKHRQKGAKKNDSHQPSCVNSVTKCVKKIGENKRKKIDCGLRFVWIVIWKRWNWSRCADGREKILAYSPTNFQLIKGCRFACFFHFSTLFSMVRFFCRVYFLFAFIFCLFFFLIKGSFYKSRFIHFNIFFLFVDWLIIIGWCFMFMCVCALWITERKKNKLRFLFDKMKKERRVKRQRLVCKESRLFGASFALVCVRDVWLFTYIKTYVYRLLMAATTTTTTTTTIVVVAVVVVLCVFHSLYAFTFFIVVSTTDRVRCVNSAAYVLFGSSAGRFFDMY